MSRPVRRGLHPKPGYNDPEEMSTQGSGDELRKAPLSNEEIRRYARQIILPEIGMEGQRRLKQASVLLIGAGGLGSPAGLYLAAAGVGRIGVVDFDVVEVSNLHRQVLHGEHSLGLRKVRSARDRMIDLNPAVQVDAYDELLRSENALRIARPYDVIIDGSDNFPTRYLSNDLCVFLGKPNIYGAVFRFEGQVTVFDARVGPCYRCFFPVPPPAGSVPSCVESGVLGVVPGIVGTLQATEALKILLGVGSPLVGRLLVYDALDQSFTELAVAKSPRCPVCGEKPSITSLIDYEEFCGVPGHGSVPPVVLGEEWEISPRVLKTRLDHGEPIRLLDVREPGEWEIVHLVGSQRIPLRELEMRLGELPREEEIVLVCRAGVRSAAALEILRKAGFRRLKNLRGGLLAWASEVDPSLPTY